MTKHSDICQLSILSKSKWIELFRKGNCAPDPFSADKAWQRPKCRCRASATTQGLIRLAKAQAKWREQNG